MADIIELIYADHDWFRRQFFLLDGASTDVERTAIWTPLGIRLDSHAQAEEEIFYPVLLQRGEQGDPEEETDDAVGDHNAIRDAVRAANEAEVGSQEWFDAVMKAREENGEHLEEEEREGMRTVIKSVSLDKRHEMGMAWLRFFENHPRGEGVDTSDRDVEEYLTDNS